MAYNNNNNNNPYTCSQFPFGGNNNNMANSQPYFQPGQVDDLTELGSSMAWMEPNGTFDPEPSMTAQSTSWQQQQPIERFMTENQRNFFTAPQISAPGRFPTLPRGIATFPSASLHTRYVSPSPSQGNLSSTQPSSAQSPSAEQDWYSDTYSPRINALEDFAGLGNPVTGGFASAFPEQQHTCPPASFPNYQSQAQSGVSMNQIQSFQDPQEFTFGDAEGYTALSQPQNDHYSTIEVDHRGLSSQPLHGQSYRYSSDEGLGASIKSVGSPAATPSMHGAISGDDQDTAYTEVDHGADAEFDEIDEASDTDYTPKASRSRKRRISSSNTTSTKRSRTTTKSHKQPVSGLLTCKDCNQGPFKDIATLHRHIAQTHMRAFVCVFAFAGCKSNFASKNEWKRHVASQHLNLSAWVCTQGACGKNHPSKKAGEMAGAEFNRKDLFTQHLRRMHAPVDVKRKKTNNMEWEEKLKELQTSCLVVKREAPRRLVCPLSGCDGVFEGAGCWDDRMEHVGKHLEQAARAASTEEVRQQDDQFLVEWADRQGIIERRLGGGGYRLAGTSAYGMEESDGDADADGEEVDD